MKEESEYEIDTGDIPGLPITPERDQADAAGFGEFLFLRGEERSGGSQKRKPTDAACAETGRQPVPRTTARGTAPVVVELE